MPSKACTKCGVVKDFSEFANNKRLRDGIGARCRDCRRAIVRDYFKRPDVLHKQALRQRDVYWENHDAQKSRRNAYRKTHSEPSAFDRDPVKESARQKLRYAVRQGHIEKPVTCQACGAAEMLHGHHEDYSKPLAVEWLCAACHGMRHRKYEEPQPLQSSTQQGGVRMANLHTPGPLADEIEAAKRRLATLEHQAVAATCIEMGHDWHLMGGANCGCEWTEDGETCRGMCSVPVHECRRCKDCDYGDNPEGEMLRADCAAERGQL